jgi:nitrogen fixation protein FixH
MTTRFTGWHMSAILVGFFAVVIAVNVVMARFASTTFGGALAENGYVASQDYNRWIADARRQDALGWSAKISIDNGHLVLDVDGVSGPQAIVRLVHPLGRVAETTLAMHSTGPVRLVSDKPMPAGRWQAHVNLSKGGRKARFILDVRS